MWLFSELLFFVRKSLPYTSMWRILAHNCHCWVISFQPHIYGHWISIVGNGMTIAFLSIPSNLDRKFMEYSWAMHKKVRKNVVNQLWVFLLISWWAAIILFNLLSSFLSVYQLTYGNDIGNGTLLKKQEITTRNIGDLPL